MSDQLTMSSPPRPQPAAGHRPRLLFLSPVVPAPLDRGQNVRIHHLVTGLARHFRVTLVVPEGPALAEDCPLWAVVDELVAVPSRTGQATPWEVLRFAARHRTLSRPGVVRWLLPYQEALDRWPVDRHAVIWVERLGLARLVARRAGRVVVDMDDLEHRKWVRELRLHRRTALGRDSLRRLYYAARFFSLEVVTARRYGHCAVASATDADYLRRWRLRRSVLLPNGAAVSDATARTARDPTGGRRLVFLGNLGYPPNVDALVHFEEDVRPALEDGAGPVELAVIGPGVTDELRARFPRITFRGFVPDLGEALRSHDVCVVPLRLGGGTKVKVLDAMAAGVPLVTTPVGAEGLALVDGVHALVAGAPQAFAAAVARLLDEPGVADSLAGAARQLVEDRYSWRSVQEQAAALAAGVAGRPSAVAAPHPAG